MESKDDGKHKRGEKGNETLGDDEGEDEHKKGRKSKKTQDPEGKEVQIVYQIKNSTQVQYKQASMPGLLTSSLERRCISKLVH